MNKIVNYFNEFGEKEEYYINDNNEKHGVYTCFYANGIEMVRCNYKNGKLHGLFQTFFMDGRMHLCDWYVNGSRISPKDIGIDIRNLSDDDFNLLTVLHG